jgi:hypothetical protein
MGVIVQLTSTKWLMYQVRAVRRYIAYSRCVDKEHRKTKDAIENRDISVEQEKH